MKTNLALCLLTVAIVVFAAMRDDERRTPSGLAGEPPRRILPTTSDQVDMLSALVGPERVVAMPEQALTWSRVAEAEGWRSLPTFARFLAEFVLESEPDLVLVSPFAEPDSVARIRESGLRTVELPTRRNLDHVIAALRRLGEIVGETGRAGELIADLEARRDALVASRTRSGEGPRPRALSYTNFGSGGWSAGCDTTIHAAMRLAGLDNALGDRVGHFEFSFEELLAVDPDLIIVSGAFGESADTIEALLRSEPGLAGVQAVVKGRILRLPPRLASAGSQELLAAAELLAREAARVLERTAFENDR